MKYLLITALIFLSSLTYADEVEIIHCSIEQNIGEARILLDENNEKYIYQVFLSGRWSTFFETQETSLKTDAGKFFVDFLEPIIVTDELRIAVRIEIDENYHALGEGEHQVQIGSYSYPKYYLNNCVGQFVGI